MIIRINTLKELEEVHNKGLIGNGTFSTGKHALAQGKPLFLGVPE
jgi:hypothetical protein